MSTFAMMGRILAKPFDFFEEIQEPGMVRVAQALYIVALAYLVRMLTLYAAGFSYQSREPYEISAVQELIWLVVPWATWCVAHWAVSAILDGEGKFREIVYGSAFALVPYAVCMIPVTLLTRILSLDESGTVQILTLAIYAWVAWLVLLKVKILHNFNLGKALFIISLSIVGMLIVWFAGILLFGLANQFISFVTDIAKELRLRA